MKTLAELREEYDSLCYLRLKELYVPEEKKTLKTFEFVKRERNLIFLCAEEKIKLGIIPEHEIPGNSYGMTYGKRKRGSWQRKGRCAFFK